jgi:hypothetical protein
VAGANLRRLLECILENDWIHEVLFFRMAVPQGKAGAFS